MSNKTPFWDALIIALAIFRALRSGHTPVYLHRENYGVADSAVLVAVGRDAFFLSHFAIEFAAKNSIQFMRYQP